MLTHLQLKNFKGWRDTGPVPLKPLTILFGTNSGGKSSIEQFFLMLKQTVDSTDRKLVLHPGDDKSAVNLGSYDAFIHRRNPLNTLSFNFSWTLSAPLTLSSAETGNLVTGDQLNFSAEIGKESERKETLVIKDFTYKLGDKSNPNKVSISLNRKPTAKLEYSIDVQGFELKRKQGRVWSLGAPMKFYGVPDEVGTYYQNPDFLQDFSLEIERLFRSVCYLGPLRSKVERLYPWTGAEPESVGYAGEQAVSALLSAKDRDINYRPKQRIRTLAKVVAEQLKNLGVIHDFKVEPIAKGQKLYEVKVKISATSDWVDLPDVGFGISQVLPVIVQSFYAPPNSILFIEQPELHLHPRAQANLADVLIDALNSRQGGKARNLQLIIETHSEHFLNRLQRRIAEAKPEHAITADQVAAYFAEVRGQESKLTPLELDLYGNVVNWPEDFFGNSMGELMAMQKAAADRRIKAAAAAE
jgi:predicted ATPase